MGRMFSSEEGEELETVNPFNGCRFGCYGGKCWAARMAKRQKGMGTEGYGNGFEPSTVLPRFEEVKA